MEPVPFDEAEVHEPEEGWRRFAMAGNERCSLEWFEKPPGHASPTHDHENEQICVVFEGELTVHTGDDSATLGPYDSVRLESGEPHRVVNAGEEPAVGVDVFVPGRSIEFWADRD